MSNSTSGDPELLIFSKENDWNNSLESMLTQQIGKLTKSESLFKFPNNFIPTFTFSELELRDAHLKNFKLKPVQDKTRSPQIMRTKSLLRDELDILKINLSMQGKIMTFRESPEFPIELKEKAKTCRRFSRHFKRIYCGYRKRSAKKSNDLFSEIETSDSAKTDTVIWKFLKRSSSFKKEFINARQLLIELQAIHFPGLRKLSNSCFHNVKPVKMTCPNCGFYITTRVKQISSVQTKLTSAALAIVGYCFFPHVVYAFKDSVHLCPLCKIYLGFCPAFGIRDRRRSLNLYKKIQQSFHREKFSVDQGKMVSASSTSAKNLFVESKLRLSDRVQVNVNNIAAITRQIQRGSKANENLIAAAKNFALQEAAIENSETNLKKLKLLLTHINNQLDALHSSTSKMELVLEQVFLQFNIEELFEKFINIVNHSTLSKKNCVKMGKNTYKKSKSKIPAPENSGSKGLSNQKKNEVNEIVKKLLKVTSQILGNVKLEWEAHLEITKLLEKVQEIEPVLGTARKREEHFPSLLSWIKENEGTIDNVTIRKYDQMGYGLEATKDLKEGELICSVSRKVMMSLENVKESPLNYLATNDPILKSMGNVALALLLIIEYLKGSGSFWYPYISSLPATYNTVLYFTVDDFLELKCSPIFEPAVKHCKNIARQYAYFNKLFKTSNDEASLLLRDSFTYQLYRWAVSTVMTRQNFIPSGQSEAPINGLIPLWDMCNHTNGYLSTQYTADKSECLACKPFGKGEQILMFYGERSNADFLVHNGFVYEENAHDSYRLRLGISKADRLHDLRCEILKELGIPESGDFYIYSGAEPVREHLLAFLRVFNMEKDDLEHWKNSTRLSDLTWKDCALNTQIESKVWNFLFNRLKLLLSTYGEVKPTSDVSECRKLVRTQISLEKKFLESALEYVQQRIKL